MQSRWLGHWRNCGLSFPRSGRHGASSFQGVQPQRQPAQLRSHGVDGGPQRHQFVGCGLASARGWSRTGAGILRVRILAFTRGGMRRPAPRAESVADSYGAPAVSAGHTGFLVRDTLFSEGQPGFEPPWGILVIIESRTKRQAKCPGAAVPRRRGVRQRWGRLQVGHFVGKAGLLAGLPRSGGVPWAIYDLKTSHFETFQSWTPRYASHSETFESWRAEKASHFETFRGRRAEKASHFESLGDFRLREVSHGESFGGCGLREVSHGES